MRRQLRRSAARPIAFAALAATIPTVVASCTPFNERRTSRVRYALAVEPSIDADVPILPATEGWPYVQRVPIDWNLDERFGVEIEILPRPTGRGTLSALLEGNADVASMSSPPLVRAIADGHDLIVIAQTVRSFDQIHLVARADHVDDWFHHPIGALPGTVFESALIAELGRAGMLDAYRRGEVEIVTAPAKLALLNSVVEGTTSSVEMVAPQAALLTATSDDIDFIDVTGDGGYLFTSFLVTTPERWQANRDGITRTAAAFAESRRVIAADPEARLQEINDFEIGEAFRGVDRPSLWTTEEIVFVTDADAIRADLTREAELLVAGGILNEVPDFTAALSITGDISR